MLISVVGKGSYPYVPKKLALNLRNKVSSLAKLSTKKPLILELKAFSSHLCYVFLGANKTLPVIIAVDLLEWQVEALLSIL